eukprot:gene14146-biopygen548
MGPEVGPAFQRRSRASSILGVRFGENGVQARGFKRNAYFLAFWWGKLPRDLLLSYRDANRRARARRARK